MGLNRKKGTHRITTAAHQMISRPKTTWQEMRLNLMFDESEFKRIREGFEPDKGTDECWSFLFEEDTLQLLLCRADAAEYKVRFDQAGDGYASVGMQFSRLIDDAAPPENDITWSNYHGMIVFTLIQHHLFGNNHRLLGALPLASIWMDMNSIHGFNHWMDVRKIGRFIAERNGADRDVIDHFAYLHDIGRTVDYEEPGHGKRSLELIKELPFELNDSQRAKLFEAVEKHNDRFAKSDDITIRTCWDADRLNLSRVGIVPDERYLYTDEAKSEEIKPLLLALQRKYCT